MGDQNLIYGIDDHARALTAFPAEEQRTLFLVGSYSLKPESKLFLLEVDDRWSRINGHGYTFDGGEVMHLTSSQAFKDNKLTFVACSFSFREGQVASRAALCSIDEPGGKVEKLGIYRLPENDGVVVKSALDPGAERLAVLSTKRLVVCDVAAPSAELAVISEAPAFGISTLANAVAWDPFGHGQTVFYAPGPGLHVLDLRQGKPNLVMTRPCRITSLDFNPFKPNRIAMGSEDGSFSLWDARNLSGPLLSVAAHQHAVWDVRFNRTYDQLVLSCAGDRRTVLHHLAAEDVVVQDAVVDSEDSVYSTAWAGSDDFVYASISYDGRIVASRVRKALKYKLLNV